MAKRTDGKTKLDEGMRQRLSEIAEDVRTRVYGAQGFPAWGTSFAEIESDAKELGQELIRLLMEQANRQQSQAVPGAALQSDSGEVAVVIGTRERILETESGPVQWPEPKAYLPKSRKDFFPSEPRLGVEG